MTDLIFAATGDKDTMNPKKEKKTATRNPLPLPVLLIGGTLVLGAHSVQAMESGSFYAGIQYSAATLKDETDFDLNALVARFGYVVSDLVRIEARVGTGIGDETQTVVVDGLPFSATYSIDNLAGLYTLLTLPIERIVLYAVAGVSTGKAGVSVRSLSVPPLFIGEISESSSTSSGSWGFGVEYQIVDRVWIGTEYMRYFSDVDAISIGLNISF